MNMKKKDEVYQELEKIRKRGRGVLRPASVVKAAEKEKSPLHQYFTWDDAKAAHEYRLEEARRLIRVFVTVREDMPTRTYVSVGSDRNRSGGGYRTINDVMASSILRDQLLKEAYRDMQAFTEKYHILKELSGVIGSMQVAMRRTKK